MTPSLRFAPPGLRGAAVTALAALVVTLDPGPAAACGGCFVQQTERTVVTDHRMALSVSPTQTVLWDQIRYSGDPAEFAWVLPVRPGATLQLSNDAFFSALDASTQPVIYAPSTYGGAMGCGVAGCGSETASGFADNAAPGPGQVQILSQSVVGPYETVTLRATDPGALRRWLGSHAFDIPVSVGPTIDAYVAESFDFIALRLRPQCGERSMQPVRIVTQGADPTLPLRMIAAGVGAHVGLTLYVISEGRFAPQNFPHAEVDESKITWSRTQSKSNYEPLVEALMADQGGRTWVTEYADQPQLYVAYDPRYGGAPPSGYVTSGSGAGVGLAQAYYSQCRSGYGAGGVVSVGGGGSAGQGAFVTPCPEGAGADAGADEDASADASASADAGEDEDASAEAGADEDAGADADAGVDASAETDAGVADDAGTGTGGGVGAGGGQGAGLQSLCPGFDDLDVALRGLHPTDVWVTRLRANLPAGALAAGDLRLEAASRQTPVSNVHVASAYEDEVSAGAGTRDACVSAPKRRTAFGSWALAIATSIAAVAMMRRRSRPPR
jgi:hypothetical protein